MSDFIIFTLTGKPFGLNFSEIDEIQNAKKGTPLPFSESWHEGMVTIRGDVYTILNLRKKLNLSDQNLTEQDKMILLRRAKIAVIVDQVEDTVSIEDSQLRNNEEQWYRQVFPSAMNKGDTPIPILDVNALLASTKS